jgi:hypothetical protein
MDHDNHDNHDDNHNKHHEEGTSEDLSMSPTHESEDADLINSIYRRISFEKRGIIDTPIHTLTRMPSLLLRSSVHNELDRVAAFEKAVTMRINNLRTVLWRNNISMDDELYTKLDELPDLVKQKAAEARIQIAQSMVLLTKDQRSEIAALKNEVTDEHIRDAAKKSSLERVIGLNILKIIGVVLLVVGVVTTVQYVVMENLMKTILLFAFGAVLLLAGELLHRREQNIFSIGISAGGVAVLYLAMAAGYFWLGVFDVRAVFVICLLISIAAVFLANRYNSQIVIAFALFGGYWPIISVLWENWPTSHILTEHYNVINKIDAIYWALFGAMTIFIVLNLLALLISFRKKWYTVAFAGLCLNVIGMVCICVIGVDFVQTLSLMSENSPILLLQSAILLFAGFSFLTYLFIPVIGTYFAGARFGTTDIMLLAANIVCSSTIIFGVFYGFSLQMFYGLLALGFAAIHLLMGVWVKAKSNEEGSFKLTSFGVKSLFYLAGLVFLGLFVPLQFGWDWFMLGWLAEGVLLAVYGILRNKREVRLAGFSIGALSVGAFFVADFLGALSSGIFWKDGLNIFTVNYSAITLGSILILGACMYKKMIADSFANAYKYAVLANAWLYIHYILMIQLHVPFQSFTLSIIYALTGLVCIVLGFVWRESWIRRLGLGFAVFAVIKLVLLDLTGLDQVFRIVSYFALGAALIAISFVYQYLSKRVESKGGAGSRKTRGLAAGDKPEEGPPN